MAKGAEYAAILRDALRAPQDEGWCYPFTYTPCCVTTKSTRPSANTYSATMVIAEKGADLIRGRAAPAAVNLPLAS